MSGTYKTPPGEAPDDGPVSDDDILTPPFDSKVAVVVRDDLETWQRIKAGA